MKQLVHTLVLIVAFASFGAFAQESVPNCNIDPDWKQSKIDATLAACKQQAQSTTPDVVVENVSAYAEVAKGVAEAIGIAAREVGVAVDDFIKTDAGKMTVALVVWHVAGDDIIGIVLGVPGIFFAVLLWFALTNRIKRTGEFITVKNRWGKEQSIHKMKPVADLDGPDGFSYLIASVFCGAIVIVCLANIFT